MTELTKTEIVFPDKVELGIWKVLPTKQAPVFAIASHDAADGRNYLLSGFAHVDDAVNYLPPANGGLTIEWGFSAVGSNTFHPQIGSAGVSLMGVVLGRYLTSSERVVIEKNGVIIDTTGMVFYSYEHVAGAPAGVSALFSLNNMDNSPWAHIGTYRAKIVGASGVVVATTSAITLDYTPPQPAIVIHITSHHYDTYYNRIVVEGTLSRELMQNETIIGSSSVSDGANAYNILCNASGTNFSFSTPIIDGLMQFTASVNSVTSNIYPVLTSTIEITGATISEVTGSVSHVGSNGNAIELFKNGVLYRTGAVYSGQVGLGFVIDVYPHNSSDVFLVDGDVLTAAMLSTLGDVGRMSAQFAVVVLPPQ